MATTSEISLQSLLREKRYKVFRNGWPDFIAVKNSEIIAVEVKGKASEKLTEEQLIIMRILAGLGVSCKKWSPDGGFEDVVINVNAIKIEDKPLPERHKEIIAYQQSHPELSLQKVGETFGISRQRISKILIEAQEAINSTVWYAIHGRNSKK